MFNDAYNQGRIYACIERILGTENIDFGKKTMAFVKSKEVLPVMIMQAKDKDLVSYNRLSDGIDVKVIQNLNMVGQTEMYLGYYNQKKMLDKNCTSNKII